MMPVMPSLIPHSTQSASELRLVRPRSYIYARYFDNVLQTIPILSDLIYMQPPKFMQPWPVKFL